MEATHVQDVAPMSEAEYLAFADAQETKYEYKRGRVYAMSGGSVRHGVLTMSVGRHIDNLLGDRKCSVTSPDVRVHIASKRTYRYPDVTVFCGDPQFYEGRTDTITNPVMLVEVLSPESAVRDYNEKLEEYTQIETLQAYLLVSQDQPKVALFWRNEAGQWIYEYASGNDAEITVPLMGEALRLCLAQIYRRIQFDEEQASGEE